MEILGKEENLKKQNSKTSEVGGRQNFADGVQLEASAATSIHRTELPAIDIKKEKEALRKCVVESFKFRVTLTNFNGCEPAIRRGKVYSLTNLGVREGLRRDEIVPVVRAEAYKQNIKYKPGFFDLVYDQCSERQNGGRNEE